MKNHLLFTVLFLCGIIVEAQETKLTYGLLMGINTSLMTSQTDISEVYLNSDPTYMRNLSLLKENQPKLSYDFGLFLKLRPSISRLSFESDFLISRFINSHSVLVNWETFYTNKQEWIKEGDIAVIDNDLSIVSIPLNIGYDLTRTEKYLLNLFVGLSPSVKIKDDNKRVDYQDNELQLYKTFILSYNLGFTMDFHKIFCSIRYDRSFNIKKTKSREYFPYSMDVNKLYLNSLSISLGMYIK